jgi:hypothetical protein
MAKLTRAIQRLECAWRKSGRCRWADTEAATLAAAASLTQGREETKKTNHFDIKHQLCAGPQSRDQICARGNAQGANQSHARTPAAKTKMRGTCMPRIWWTEALVLVLSAPP